MSEEIKLEGNLDIQKALKEFETKSSAEETQKIPETSETPDVPKMVGLAMKWFKIKEQKTAEYVLLGVAVVAFAVSLFLFFGGGNTRPVILQSDLFLTPPSAVISN